MYKCYKLYKSIISGSDTITNLYLFTAIRQNAFWVVVDIIQSNNVILYLLSISNIIIEPLHLINKTYGCEKSVMSCNGAKQFIDNGLSVSASILKSIVHLPYAWHWPSL